MGTETRLRILSVDDHDLFRDGLRQILTSLGDSIDLIEAATAAEARALLAKHADELALLLLDLHLPDEGGIAFLRSLRADYPDVPIAVLSSDENPREMRQALDLDALGYIPKSSPRNVLASALRLVLEGGVYVPPGVLREDAAPAPDRFDQLTPRQRDVALLLAKGLTNKEIGSVLGIRAPTVKKHVEMILATLDVSNRTEAVAVMVDLGVLDG